MLDSKVLLNHKTCNQVSKKSEKNLRTLFNYYLIILVKDDQVWMPSVMVK